MLFALKNFWPRRSEAKGFSIENFARKYRDKISKATSKNNSNQFSFNTKSKSTKELSNDKAISYLSIRKDHWANRDFSEYREAA